ncbi:fumarylacetoacetate hydrolase family protein [Staphylococcus auricularis]|uniref:fumarylacetoacetate hydrolase family protein n=1 Tax=Staphylococcus auricularis TaxID=29379 RepID=UPI0012479341
MVSKDEVGRGGGVKMVSKVNKEIGEDGNRSEMILKIEELIEGICKYVGVDGGDMIGRGRGGGVGGGMDEGE